MRAEFQLGAFTGVIPESQSANAVWFAFRNPSQSRGCRIRRIEVMARSESGPTAKDKFSLEGCWCTGFDTNYSGGTDLSDPTAPAYFLVGPESGLPERRAGVDTQSILQTGCVTIAGTAALGTSTPTIQGFPFMWDERLEPAAATETDRPGLNLIWTPSDEASRGGKGRVLKVDEGFIIRNPLATGAGHTWRAFVRVAWEES